MPGGSPGVPRRLKTPVERGALAASAARRWNCLPRAETEAHPHANANGCVDSDERYDQPMSTSPRAERLARARKEMADRGVEAVLVGPSADFRYLTGYLPPGLERLTMLVVPAEGTPRLLVPALEAPLASEHLGDLEVDLLAWEETD